MSSTPWTRLIRFVDDNGNETFGEPCIQSEDELIESLVRSNLYAVEYKGKTPTSATTRGEKIHVKSLLNLFKPSDVPIIRCIGLNYLAHIKESGKSPPPYPSVFIKPGTSVAGHDEDIPIPKIAQDGTLDYEGELGVVMGRTGKDIPKSEALSYVAGYCAANDVSARGWQRDPKKAGAAPQWCFSKGFDKFAPLSPMLVAPALVGDASGLQLRTLVNGEERQSSSVGDLLFGVEEIVAFVSQGTTVEAGTVVLTGTPAGVAQGEENGFGYLCDGDVVEVFVGGVGGVRNCMRFE